MLERVTITGADNSVAPSELALLSKKYPFVEWGILVSKKSIGQNRFPSLDWIKELGEIYRSNPDMQLSCHVCGRWVNEILETGDVDERTGFNFDMFDRVQLNTHGRVHESTIEAYKKLARFKHEYIFQYDTKNSHLIELAEKFNVKHSALFDVSGGNGILPKKWEAAKANCQFGYAGGLSPDNLEEQIPKILSASGGESIWIDMETYVRSDDDTKFDLEKVDKCLEIASKYVSDETSQKSITDRLWNSLYSVLNDPENPNHISKEEYNAETKSIFHSLAVAIPTIFHNEMTKGNLSALEVNHIANRLIVEEAIGQAFSKGAKK